MFSKEDGWLTEQAPNSDGIPVIVHVTFKGTALSQRYIHTHAYTELHDKYERLRQSMEKSN